MIKKKKKQHNQNRQIKGAAGYNTYEETVRRIYLLCLREVKNGRRVIVFMRAWAMTMP